MVRIPSARPVRVLCLSECLADKSPKLVPPVLSLSLYQLAVSHVTGDVAEFLKVVKPLFTEVNLKQVIITLAYYELRNLCIIFN